MMKLRGTDFGPVMGASGVQGFYGEGYPYHRYFKPLGLDFSGMTLVAKTVTWEERMNPSQQKGNMELDRQTLAPTKFLPDCIKVNWRRGFALNAVGLSNPGLKNFLRRGRWQELTEPFSVSLMAVDTAPEDKVHEISECSSLLYDSKRNFRSPFALQLNVSCPNTGGNVHVTQSSINGILGLVEIAGTVGVPVMPKFSLTTDPEIAARIASSKYCDAICVSNTVPWGALPEKIDWFDLFGSNISPLAKYGGGGLSGRPLLPLVADWIKQFRELDPITSINAGGGIIDPEDVDVLARAGANSVFIGSMAFLRPWNVQKTIQRAYRLFN